jgi:hypothetical protein
MKSYKIRRFANGKNAQGDTLYNHSITLPPALVHQLPEDIRYEVELLEDIPLPNDPSIPKQYRGRTIRGILLSPALPDPKPELPEWARTEKDGNGIPGNERPARQAVRRRPGSASTSEN